MTKRINQTLETMPKCFVMLDLSAGGSLEKGFKKPHSEQSKEDFARVLRAINRKMMKRAEAEGWVYDFYASISNEHLSDDSEDYNANNELGVDNNRRTNWHIHMIFYSATSTLDELLHIANVFRRYWVSDAKGCYNIGCDKANLNARICNVARYFYARLQENGWMLLSNHGKISKGYFREIVENELNKLDVIQLKEVERLKAKWAGRHKDIINKV